MDTKLSKSETNIGISNIWNRLTKVTMRIQIFCFLLTINLIYSQDYVKKDSLKIKGKDYNFSHLSFGKSNLTKYFKVMTCTNKEYSKIEKEIISCASKTKLEYSEFYLLSIPECKSRDVEDYEILTEFIHKIDAERMGLNLSTALIKSKYDFENNKFEYFLNQAETDFKEYKLNIKQKEVCAFLKN